ncbi:hypothetical protein RD110_18095 [Rhodoferax koreense]|uniref:Uncharacterized protein n=1 Tax=Rhodoferax koreensis TaxID=1842727 RepID=A0A1P8JYR3_9BURK|nr:hypothetical protein [Rhodoferax koreense]APW38885.1 hypothetical protein RD110_18095 [Rhodoferax koreense]
MDFDGIASRWANSRALSSPAILADLLAYDPQQLGQLRASVARYAELAHAVELIDVLTAFHLARQRLDEARQAAHRISDLAGRMAQDAAAVPAMALASVERAVHAQEAAHQALERAQTGREKINAAVVLELADVAATKALEASEAADQLTLALAALIQATQPEGAHRQHVASRLEDQGHGEVPAALQ